METKVIESTVNSLLEQGVLGSVLVILFLMFKKFIERLFKVVENNTIAMTKTSDALYEVKKVINKCEQ